MEINDLKIVSHYYQKTIQEILRYTSINSDSYKGDKTVKLKNVCTIKQYYTEPGFITLITNKQICVIHECYDESDNWSVCIPEFKMVYSKRKQRLVKSRSYSKKASIKDYKLLHRFFGDINKHLNANREVSYKNPDLA